MRRLVLTLGCLAAVGGGLVPAIAAPAPAHPASSTIANPPPPCPVRQLVSVRNNTVYVSVGCTTVAVPIPATTGPHLP